MQSGPIFHEISVAELNELCKKPGSVQLIDVRETDEYAEFHAAFASNVPLSRLKLGLDLDKLPKALDTTLYLICRSGKRSATACSLLHKVGYKNLFNVTGGMLAWNDESLPMAD